MKKNHPRVSIITPCYNRESLVRETLESCLRQSVEDFEVIVIDDGSTDHSFSTAKAFAARDHRVHAHRTVNHGLAIARNIGASLAQGDYFWFLDSDDMLMPDSLELYLQAAEETKAPIVIFREGGFYTEPQHADDVSLEQAITFCEGTREHPERNPHKRIEYDNLLFFMREQSCSFNNVMIHRNIFDQVGGFNPALRGCEDSEMLHRIGLLLPDSKVLYQDYPICLLKRLGHFSLAQEIRQNVSTTPWLLLSTHEICKTILKHKLDTNKHHDFFDKLYLGACIAHRNGATGHALMAYETWLQAQLPIPHMKPAYHHHFHQLLGFKRAEACLSLCRKILGKFR